MFPVKKILCPTDFSEPSYEALARAAEFARHFGAHLTVLNVTSTLAEEARPGHYADSEYDQLEMSLNREKVCQLIAERIPVSVEASPLVVLGDAAHEIVRVARNESIDLIVIATHGLTGWRHLVFGSVAERVLRLAQCPVLVLHAPGVGDGAGAEVLTENHF